MGFQGPFPFQCFLLNWFSQVWDQNNLLILNCMGPLFPWIYVSHLCAMKHRFYLLGLNRGSNHHLRSAFHASRLCGVGFKKIPHPPLPLCNCLDWGDRFCEILALNYAPGAAAPGTAAPGADAPGAWIIWSNIPSQICSRSIFECTMLQEHKANMLQEHI